MIFFLSRLHQIYICNWYLSFSEGLAAAAAAFWNKHVSQAGHISLADATDDAGALGREVHFPAIYGDAGLKPQQK